MPFAVVLLGGAITLAYVLYAFAPVNVQEDVFNRFALAPARYDPGSPYHFGTWDEAVLPLIGHVFLHGGWAHLLMNMLAYFQAAPFVGWRMGGARFLMLFFLAALGGAGAYILINPHSALPAVGASGAICGVFGAYFLAVRPSPREALADPQIRNAIVSFLGINVVLMGVLAALHVFPIAWEAHLGGFIVGALAYPLLALRRQRAGPWG